MLGIVESPAWEQNRVVAGTCSIDGCAKPSFARTWCSAHYSRWQRHGDPEAITRQSPIGKDATEKTCPKCRVTKSLDQFGTRSGGRGPKGYCIECDRTYWSEYLATERGAERRRKASTGWSDRNHGYFLNYRYGITVAEYEALRDAQGDRCAICRCETPSGNNERWSVDHDHETGKVRGLLCAHCNLGIGQFGEDPERLRAAADYLDRSSE